MHALTDAQWSPTRSSIFYTTKMDGTLDVWDILFKQNEPTLSIQVVDEPLHCLRVQESQGRLVACGSQNGTVTLVEVSDNLCIQGKSEKGLVSGVSY
jgi:dynein intermediate chain 2